MIIFFQAEDGIRDTSVTGVQTCSLQILNQSDIKSLKQVLEIASAGFPDNGLITFIDTFKKKLV